MVGDGNHNRGAAFYHSAADPGRILLLLGP